MHFHDQRSGWLRQCYNFIMTSRNLCHSGKFSTAPPKKMCPYAYGYSRCSTKPKTALGTTNETVVYEILKWLQMGPKVRLLE